MADRLKRKEKITAQRQEQILKAALAAFSRKGFGRATVADVALEAGTSVGTIYNYYQDKNDLLLSLITQNLMPGNLDEIASSAGSSDAESFISALIADRLKTGFSNAQQILFLLFEIQRSPALKRKYSEEVIQPILHLIESVIRKKVKDGAFRQVDEAVIARTFAGIIIGIMILFRLEGRDSPFQKSRIPEITSELTNLLLNGLKKPEGRRALLKG